MNLHCRVIREPSQALPRFCTRKTDDARIKFFSPDDVGQIIRELQNLYEPFLHEHFFQQAGYSSQAIIELIDAWKVRANELMTMEQ